MTRILTGPVVGKVDDTSARILLESDTDGIVSASAQAADETAAVSAAATDCHHATVKLTAGRPGAFHFRGLRPGTRYHVQFDGLTPSRRASFRTLSSEASEFNILCLSCNDVATSARSGAWDRIAELVDKGRVDFVFHLGDQVYADRAYWKAAERFSLDRQEEWEHETAELFREVYRRTWSSPSVAAVLANTSNLMIWDDHEIRDNWSATEVADGPVPNRSILRIGRVIGQEYQRQLWDSQDEGTPDGPEFHWHRLGNLGVVFLDPRGGREAEKTSPTPYLGREQWVRLHQALGASGDLQDVEHLVVAGPIPLAFLSEGLTSVAARLFPDVRDQWSYRPYRPERIKLLELCREWQSSRPHRKVTFLAGDAHVGFRTEILFHGEASFEQLTSSPIASVGLPTWVESVLRILCSGTISIGGGYAFRHLEWKGNANFGVLRIGHRGDPGKRELLLAGARDRLPF